MTVVDGYHATYRRMLLDMHIPDWDERFLRDYDPKVVADRYQEAGANGALVYCKSHLGLNYWPCPVGAVHRAARERDLVGEVTRELRRRGIAVAAYHSVVFDNWAAEAHPEWAVVPATTERRFDWHLLGPRYGTLCPNQAGYREYEHAQIRALLERFDFDTLWLDMAFWTCVCICSACVARYATEHGREIPRTVDWTDPEWTRFQAAREAWIEEFLLGLIAAAQHARPGVAVTHNLAPGLHNWLWGQRADHCRHDAFAAGDLYGGRDEQLVVLKLMASLTRSTPTEFMTSRTRDLHSHSSTKTEHEMLTQALAATSHGSAFLFIDAIDPSGQLNGATYQRMGRVFDRVEPYEQFLGGDAVEDIALYYSDDSRIDLADNGSPVGSVFDEASAHVRALTGAARTLQRAHLPFAVITRLQLDSLDQYRVVVLPEVTRMTREEVAAFRDYVGRGGRLYASGRTSLLTTDGEAAADFLLADVFGCALVGFEEGEVIYLKPKTPELVAAFAPEPYLPFGSRSRAFTEISPPEPVSAPRVRPRDAAQVLATLTLPYGYPSPGTVRGRDFASIHSSPPWDDRGDPVILHTRYGEGACIYSAVSLEGEAAEATDATFVELIRQLAPGRPRVGANAHPDVWITVFHQAGASRYVVSALHYTDEPPVGPVPVSVQLDLPGVDRVMRVVAAPSGQPARWRMVNGQLEIDMGQVDLFAVCLVTYQP